jgi:hypothetical protein
MIECGDDQISYGGPPIRVRVFPVPLLFLFEPSDHSVVGASRRMIGPGTSRSPGNLVSGPSSGEPASAEDGIGIADDPIS